MLSEKFTKTLIKIGMPILKAPLFYNSPIGIRFLIGKEQPVYLDGASSDDLIPNPKYISAALERAESIYNSLLHQPDILRIDTDITLENLKQLQLPKPHEQTWEQIHYEDISFLQKQLFWNLSHFDFNPHFLLKEIIKADIGGAMKDLTSNVYFINTEDSILFHLYDDCGADLLASDKNTLRPFYETYNDWLLDYDRTKIDKLFAI